MGKVYEEFYGIVGYETNRRDVEFAKSPWMGWDKHILHMRLVEAREYDAKRHTDIRRAKTMLQMAKLAVEWQLPIISQQEWVDKQRPSKELLSWYARGPAQLALPVPAPVTASRAHNLTVIPTPGTRRGTIRATTSRARLSFCRQGTKYPAHLEAAVAGRPRMRGRRTAVEGATAVRLPTGRRLTRTSSRLLQAHPLPRTRPLQPRTRLLQAGPAKHLSIRQGQIGAGPPAARCCGNDRVEGATAAVRKILQAALSVYRIRP